VNRFRTVALTAFVGLVLVACGPAASGSESQGAGASHAAASQPAQASKGGAQPSAGVVAELEALIPDTIGTLTLTKSSMRGNDFLAAQGSDATTIKFIQDLGISPSDMSIAIGSGSDAATGAFAAMFVLRAAGADSNRLLSGFETAMNADAASPVQWTDATVGGKHVKVVAADTANTYVYAKGDTVFWIFTSVEADAVTVLSGLP
jgi:hypothetical protein